MSLHEELDVSQVESSFDETSSLSSIDTPSRPTPTVSNEQQKENGLEDRDKQFKKSINKLNKIYKTTEFSVNKMIEVFSIILLFLY